MFTGLHSAFYCVLQCSHFFTAHFTALYSPFYSTAKEGRDFPFTVFTAFTANPPNKTGQFPPQSFVKDRLLVSMDHGTVTVDIAMFKPSCVQLTFLTAALDIKMTHNV